jgi:heat shock protein HtpX
MNHIKTFFLLMVLTGLLLLIGAAVGGEVGLIIAVIFALAVNSDRTSFEHELCLDQGSGSHSIPLASRST